MAAVHAPGNEPDNAVCGLADLLGTLKIGLLTNKSHEYVIDRLALGSDKDDGLQNATEAAVNKRASRSELASSDAPLDHSLHVCVFVLLPHEVDATAHRRHIRR